MTYGLFPKLLFNDLLRLYNLISIILYSMKELYPLLYALLVVRIISRELLVVGKFISNNIWDTILPSLMIFFTGWIYNGRHWAELPYSLFNAISYAILYIYTFCISNQLAGIEEDRINKPYRPLVTGLVSIRATYHRMYIYNIVFSLYGLYLGIFWLSIAWIALSAYLNLWGGSNHWVTKNLVGMSLGTFILFGVQWHISLAEGQTISSKLQEYFALMSLWAGFSLPIQDFRDAAGDKLLSRKTLPVSLGDDKARKILCIHYLFFLPAIFLCAILSVESLREILQSVKDQMIFIFQLLIHWLVALRLLKYRAPEADHNTYIIYVLLFIAAIPTVYYLKI